ncbi:MAG: XRE family transcriptional regulator [Clostridiales bacterium]|nr:XRE family transcriptional regulator [Clostridiales bacterium]
MAVRKLNNNLNVIGENLRKFRIERHYSQMDLTKELNLLGLNLHKNDIWLIEANKRTVKDYEVWGFVKVLGIDFLDLYNGIENKLES